MKHYLLLLFTLSVTVFPISTSEINHPVPHAGEQDAVQIEEAAQRKNDDLSKPIIKKVWVTAYSSTPEETDDTPFITAMGTEVRDGIVAANFLPFGTRVKIPSLFGDKVFVVEDRMHSRKTNFADVWMPTKKDAVEFGIHYTELLILESHLLALK